MAKMITGALVLLALIGLSGCGGGGRYSVGAHFGVGYGISPWYYHGGYVRDRVHVVSEEELKALEELATEAMPQPENGGAPEMGFGDADIGDMDLDIGGLD